ncbi:mycofactocin biosynthesis glycosyltransferase MftF [Nocardioides sp. TRM66260-LWL]|uniref:mycofactocin biosynthesis glycosyltransferase MftF n=1 Tax=Nocardioides sp. TRM66260-LWL TaxID=2874478 RepID=UPI001CC756DD|nr:mycofactocin biosynthesis glycosyltransferase MftF [Nocardioides sp. TRM66260-LWL]MBZ5735333.1 mycofactocin biosynthesis glycosyltransferase MftF [Nocardioides sp. TRM66260-LWL]
MTLPLGFRGRLRPDVVRLDDGDALLGGSPLRMLRLSCRARAALQGDVVTVTDAISAAVLDALLEADLAEPEPEPADATVLDDLTVVVPVRDRPEQLERTLAALRSDGAPGRPQIVVVDDASAAPEQNAMIAARHGARFLPLATNVGPAGARNEGTRAASTRLVAFVDSDVQVGSAALLELTAQLADPRVAMVAPRVVGRPATSSPGPLARFEAGRSALDLGPRSGLVQPGTLIPYVPSACLVARREVVLDAFDVTRRVGEDVDLVWRLADAGHRIRYQAEVVAEHEARGSLVAWACRVAVYGTSAAPLARAHGAKVAPARLHPSIAVTALGLLSRRRWGLAVGIATGATAIHRVRRQLPPGESRLATRLTLQGIGWGVRQETTLMLRHWWPVTAVLAMRCPGARRVVGSAILVQAALDWREEPEHSLRPLSLVGRRVEDLAYGAGVWWGCWRARSLAALVPSLSRDRVDGRRPARLRSRSSRP